MTTRMEALASDFIDSVGVCLHLGNRPSPYFTAIDQVVPLLKGLGVKHVRDEAFFYVGVTSNHDFYVHARILADAGMRFTLVCQDPLNGILYTQPSQVPNIYDWMNHSIEMFEGSNESPLTRQKNVNPLISRDHQAGLYGVMKSTPTLSSIPVASPSYVQGSVPLALSMSDVVDCTNLHPYPGMEHPETSSVNGALSGFISRSVPAFGTKPVVVTETGYNTALQTASSFLPVSDAIKARYLPRLLLWSFVTGVKRTYLYQLIDHIPPSTTDVEATFGLVDFNLNPKPSYVAVKNLLTLFNPKPSTLPDLQYSIDCSVPYQSIIFKQPDHHLLFIWQGVSGWNSQSRTALAPVTATANISFTTPPTRVLERRFTDSGTLGATWMTGNNGSYVLTASDQLSAYHIYPS